MKRRQKAEEAADPSLINRRAHGHNQHTPPDVLVKNGAPSLSIKNVKTPGEETLAVMKAEGRKRKYLEGSSRDSSETILARKKAKAEFGARAEGKTAYEVNAFPDTGADGRAHASPNPNQTQDGEEDSGSDEMLFPKETARPRRRVSTPASTAAKVLDIPRQMGYIERRKHEEALALETVDAVKTQDDVLRISKELAEANVLISDQRMEIETLRKALKDKVKEMNDRVKELQGVIDEQELAMEDIQAERRGKD